MHIFCDLKISIGIKKPAFCKFAFSVDIIAAVIPHGVAAIGICTNVVWYICNHKLRLWNPVFFVILKIIVVKFYHFPIIPSIRPPQTPGNLAPSKNLTCGLVCRAILPPPIPALAQSVPFWSYPAPSRSSAQQLFYISIRASPCFPRCFAL